MANKSIYETILTEIPTSDDTDSQPHPDIHRKEAVLGKRHGQVLLFTCMMFLYINYEHIMSISLVAMTDPTASINKDIPTYNWTNKNNILSAYMWGIMSPQLIGGWLVDTYSPKWFIVGSMVISSCVGLIIPVSASVFGEMGVLVCRTIQGLCLSILPSGAYAVISKWVPLCERSRMTAVMQTGGSAGGMLSLFSSGYIAASWYGWPMSFYCFNSLGLLWVLLFIILGRNCPGDHSTISSEEILLITNGRGPALKKLGTPWYRILTSSCFWALVSANCAHMWGCDSLMSVIPMYLKSVMGFNIESNASLSAAFLLAKWILSIFFGFLGDFLINKNILNVGKTRKIMEALASLVPCVSLILLGSIRLDQRNECIALLIISVGFSSATISGHLVNYLDIAPNHCGTLYGISSQIAMAMSSAAPLVVKALVPDESDPEQWKYYFYLTCGILAASTIFFSIFGSGEIQTWNEEIRKGEEPYLSETNGVIEALHKPRE